MAKIKINVLSDADIRLLKSIVAQVKQEPQNTPGRTYAPPDPQQTPDVYIALIPVGGIAGRVGLAVSSAECQIYRLLSDTLTDAGFTRLVHNLSVDALSAGLPVLAERDKFGIWWAADIPDAADTEVVETGTGTGTGTSGETSDCLFDAAQLALIAGSGLGVDATGTCPQLKVQTTPPSCVGITFQEVDLRCETMTGTGTSELGSLNLYRRTITLNTQNGCLVQTAGAWEFVRSVACCDPTCEQDPSFWWCISEVTGTEGTISTSCCGNLLPEDLTVTITNGGACNGSYTATYNPSFTRWEYSGALGTCPGGGSPNITITCDTGTWNIVVGVGGQAPDSITCDPINLVVNSMDLSMPCGGDASATITITV